MWAHIRDRTHTKYPSKHTLVYTLRIHQTESPIPSQNLLQPNTHQNTRARAHTYTKRNNTQVFQWFADDFTKAGHASVLDALMPYMPEDVREHVGKNQDKLKVSHFDYDWGLNGPSPGAAGKEGSC